MIPLEENAYVIIKYKLIKLNYTYFLHTVIIN